ERRRRVVGLRRLQERRERRLDGRRRRRRIDHARAQRRRGVGEAGARRGAERGMAGRLPIDRGRDRLGGAGKRRSSDGGGDDRNGSHGGILYHWRVSMRFGRYELLRPLGAGGMAEVFLARYVGPEGFEKRLVIKRVLPRLSDDRHLLRMFFEEAKTHVSLSHGNLVSVFDFGRVGNEYFLAMEHVPGADLGLLLHAARTDGGPLPAAL